MHGGAIRAGSRAGKRDIVRRDATRGLARLPDVADLAHGNGQHAHATDLKRLFAYSSVGQIGYIILGLSFDSASGLTATILHLFNHGITKGAIFMLLGLVALVMGGTSLLIVVNVTVDTISQIQSHLLAHQYGDLIKKAKLKGRLR